MTRERAAEIFRDHGNRAFIRGDAVEYYPVDAIMEACEEERKATAKRCAGIATEARNREEIVVKICKEYGL